jgi:hypothetical protein
MMRRRPYSIVPFLTSEDAMATRAPAVRKHLSADALFSRLRTGFSTIANHRPGTPKIPVPDTLMSAFARFSLKLPSLLAFDDERKEGNLQHVYGIGQVPCDIRMREILDPVDPESLRPLFKSGFVRRSPISHLWIDLEKRIV